MASLRTVHLGAVGSAGQNTEAPHIDLPPQFGTLVLNGEQDDAGRLAARRSIRRVTANNADLGTDNPLARVFRHVRADGQSFLISAGNNRIFRSDVSTLTQISSGHSGDLWQFATLNGRLFAAQVGHSLRWFNETTWAESTISTPANPRAICAAYGRLWALSEDGWTLYWSDLLDGTNFTSGASGSLNLLRLHTNLRSPAVAVVGFGRAIFVFCRDQTLVLGLAEDLNPNNTTQPIYLQEHLPAVGCVARDTVAVAGDDVVFLAADGVRSLQRSLMELRGPAPMSVLSAANKRALLTRVASAGSDLPAVSAAWVPSAQQYMLFLPKSRELWMFDVTGAPEKPPFTSVWQTSEARTPRHAALWTDGEPRFAVVGGLADNLEYDEDDSYSLVVETGWMSFEAPHLLKHLKRVVLNAYGGAGQAATLRWYVEFDDGAPRSETFFLNATDAPSEYGIGEYGIAEYSTGLSAADNYILPGGSAKLFKFSFSLPISSRAVAINSARVDFVLGKTR